MTSATARQRPTPPAGGYPPRPELLPAAAIEYGRYRVRFARHPGELDAVLRLRYRVFNLELGEGLAASAASGRDEDAFDAACHHLLVEDAAAGTVIGTYRMQTAAMAAGGGGFYSAGLFDLSTLPPEVTARSIEVGRACIAREHRNRQVLFLLWKGLARYLASTGTRYLFGCCSLTSQDPDLGQRVCAHLEARDQFHPWIRVAPRPGLECAGDAGEAAAAVAADPSAIQLPSLFRTYLRYGAVVCGAPAIDREFKTIDFLVLLDSDAIAPQSRALFFD